MATRDNQISMHAQSNGIIQKKKQTGPVQIASQSVGMI